MLMNSTVQLSLSYSYGENQIIVALYGPSDSRRGQDPSKAIVELTIRDTTTKTEGEGGALGYNLESLRSELKGILEQVISLGSYPKGILSFQIFIVKN
jgi:ribonuclease PH